MQAGGGGGDDAGEPLSTPTLLVLRGGQLTALPSDEVSQLPLPPVPARGRHLLRVWLRSPCRLRNARLAATLLCPAPVTAALALNVDEPFAHSARLFGETGVHALVGPSAAFAGGGGGGGAAPLPLVIGQPVMVQVSCQGCSLCVHDARRGCTWTTESTAVYLIWQCGRKRAALVLS